MGRHHTHIDLHLHLHLHFVWYDIYIYRVHKIKNIPHMDGGRVSRDFVFATRWRLIDYWCCCTPLPQEWDWCSVPSIVYMREEALRTIYHTGPPVTHGTPGAHGTPLLSHGTPWPLVWSVLQWYFDGCTPQEWSYSSVLALVYRKGSVVDSVCFTWSPLGTIHDPSISWVERTSLYSTGYPPYHDGAIRWFQNELHGKPNLQPDQSGVSSRSIQ